MNDVVPMAGFFEPVSSWTHLLGALGFAVASGWLLWRGRGDRLRELSLVVFCTSAVLLLLTSGLYHMLPLESSWRPLVRRLDHAAIFVLIAGSFTPSHTILFRGWARSGALALIWGVAVTGITLKMIYFEVMPPWLGTGLYLAMGWLGLISCVALWRAFGFAFIVPLLWGGLAYTVGAVLDVLQWPVMVAGIFQWHELLHVAVLLGLATHWAFTYRIADGHVPPLTLPRRETCLGESLVVSHES